ncbi:MAG TPA: HIT family protein [Caulobacteraceae bacterium]|jgi:histidine triad (HIT) family protein
MDRFSSARSGEGGKPCAFCAIVGGERPAARVFEDELTLAILDHSPLAIGHVLLMPKAHVATLPELDNAALTAVAQGARALAAALPRALEADGSFVAQNNVVSQSVPHLHVHLVPRWRGDRLFSHNLSWRRVRYRDEAQMAETAARIAAALQA